MVTRKLTYNFVFYLLQCVSIYVFMKNFGYSHIMLKN